MKSYNRNVNTRLSSHFSSREFNCKCGKCSTTLIDTQLVRYLQLIRNHFGKEVVITSGFRCSEHNKNVGGASKSNHMLGKAADIKVHGVEPKEVAKYAESIGVKGIGVYKTFTHLDTRANKYFWYDGGQSNVSTFGSSAINPSNTPTNIEQTATNKIMVSLPTLQNGSKNKYVKLLQAILDIEIDGVYGKETESAVKGFQKNSGLSIDGVTGPQTWRKLLE